MERSGILVGSAEGLPATNAFSMGRIAPDYHAVQLLVADLRQSTAGVPHSDFDGICVYPRENLGG